MLVMCIHLPSKTIFAVPGALLPDKTFSGKSLGSTEDGNTDYIVQPEELATFLRELVCCCLGRQERMFMAYQDCHHDVSSIRMVTQQRGKHPQRSEPEESARVCRCSAQYAAWTDIRAS